MSKEKLSKKNQRLFLIIAIAAVVGLADTTYLTVSHLQGGEVVCSIVDGCNLVLASSWATILGVPTALLGGLYYLAILLLLIFSFYKHSQISFLAILGVATVGFIVSLGFLYLQLGVIGAVCEYCLLSVVATTVIWVAALGKVYKGDNGI